MALHYKDLPAALRRAVDASEERSGPKQQAKKPRRAKDDGIYRCAACGVESVGYPAAEAHADETSHGRIECLIIRRR